MGTIHLYIILYDLLDQILRENGFVSHEGLFVTYLIQSFKF